MLNVFRYIAVIASLYAFFMIGSIYANHSNDEQLLRRTLIEYDPIFTSRKNSLSGDLIGGSIDYRTCLDSRRGNEITTNKTCGESLIDIDATLLTIQSEINLDDQTSEKVEQILNRADKGQLSDGQDEVISDIAIAIQSQVIDEL